MNTDCIEFFIVNPFEDFKKTTQELYLNNLNKAFEKLMEEMYIPDPQDLVEDGPFTFCISCESHLNEIKVDGYEYIFSKDKFFDFKSHTIKNNLYAYYNPKGVKINKLFRDRDNYFIVLTKYNK